MSRMITPIQTNPAFEQVIAGIPFSQVVLNASGCFNPMMFNRITPLEGCLGAIVTKTITPEPRAGNAQQRTAEIAGVGMLNSIGLQNPGLAVTLDTDIADFSTCGVPIMASIAATSVEEFGVMVKAMDTHENGQYIAGYEVNLSCPNVAKGGVDFGRNPALITDILKHLTSSTTKPCFAKLTPNVASMIPMAEAAVEGGAVGITAINTLLGAHIDVNQRRLSLSRGSGGYSGPGIKPVAIHHVCQLRKALPQHIHIIGVGGAQYATDVLEFMMAGASLVQVGTACFRTPTVFAQLQRELAEFVREEGIQHISEIVGCVHS